MQKNNSVFDKDFYDKKIWGSSEIDPNRPAIDLLKLERLLQSKKSWQDVSCLEVGCGTGRYLRGLKRILPSECISLHGCDISVKSLEIAREIGGGIEYREMPIDQVPYADGTFDVVCFFDVMEHVENPGNFVREAVRILKPGGILHASVPVEGDWVCLWRWFDFIRLHHKTKFLDGQIQRFSRKSLKEEFAVSELTMFSETYSYQIIGNLMDFALFNTLQIMRLTKPKATHYDIVNSCRSNKRSLLTFISRILDRAMYTEAVWLAKFPGMNAHYSLIKK
jgi:SAM-dependent methyltransferase